MDNEQLFTLANALVLPGWALLMLAPRWRPGTDIIAPVIIPGVLAALYVVLAVSSLGEPGDGSFSSLAGVAALFERPEALLAGWIHYLAFDLFIGAWEVRDARRRGINHLVLVPCLGATLMLGPIGLLMWLSLRSILASGLSVSEAAAEARAA